MRKVLLVGLLLAASFASAQTIMQDQNTNTWGLNGALSGAALNYPDIKGTITEKFEIVVNGTAPASLTVTVVGCMRGGTCSSTLASSSGTSSQLLTPTSSDIFDFYKITTSWTGGDATTQFVINRTGTVARKSSGGGGSVNAGTTGQYAFYAANGSTISGGGPITTNALAKGDATNALAASLLSDNGTTATYTGTGGLVLNATGTEATITQGTITSNLPAITNTTTWNAAGVAFTHQLFNVTCTAAAANSRLLSLQVASADVFAVNFNGANCATAQLLIPVGSSSVPSMAYVGDTTTGWVRFAAGNLGIRSSGTNVFSNGGLVLRVASTGVWGFTSTVDSNGTVDTGLSRDAAGVVDVGTGASGNSAGVLKAAAYRGGGAAATLTGTGSCATFSGQVGGSSTGQAACASATAASTLTITPGTTAPNGWVCYVQDETTRANLFQQTSHTTTACTLTATSVTQNDVFVFTAFQY